MGRSTTPISAASQSCFRRHEGDYHTGVPSPAPVAVVIPCYNHGAYLPEALASVRAQTHPAAACIIVNDGSTEPATLRALRDADGQPGVRIISQSNQGLAAARNAGVRASAVPFFVPLDADDRLAPGFIERLLPALLRAECTSHAYAWTRFFGARSGLWRCEAYDPQRLILHNLHPATALIRRSAFDAVGGYQADMVQGYEDWDLWLALAAAGWRGSCVAEPLFEYRQHAAGASMLGQMGDRRRAMRRRMIEHHLSFFHRWYDGWIGVENPRAPAHLDADALLRELEAALEVDFIERSRAWRWLGGRRTGPGSPAWSVAGRRPSRGIAPTARLMAIRTGRRYRFIQWLKRRRAYRWFADWRYTDDARQATL